MFVLISIFTAVGSGTLNYLESRRLIIDQFHRSMQDITATAGAGLTSRTDAASEAIMRISGNPILLSEDAAKIQLFLQTAVDSSSVFNNIYFFQPTGELKAAAYADGRDLSKYANENFNKYAENEKTRDVYLDLIRALETRTPVFSAFFQSHTGRLMNSFIVPVVAEDRVVGLLSCGIVLDKTSKLLDLLERLKPHEQGFVAIVGREGKFLLHSGNIPEGLENDRSWKSSDQKAFSENGYMLSIFNLPKTELGICIGLPETAVTELLQSLRTKTIHLTAFGSLIASILGLIAAYILISPMKDLVCGLRKLNEGNAGTRINRMASGEVAEAINCFNEISDRIRRHPELIRLWSKSENDS